MSSSKLDRKASFRKFNPRRVPMQIKHALESKWREMYWEKNELQIIATPATLRAAAKLEVEMCHIEAALGYLPAA